MAHSSQRSGEGRTDGTARAVVGALAARLAAATRAVAFWAAIVLPLAYLPLLYGGIDGRGVAVFAGLLAVNAVCLHLGADYSPSTPPRQ